jgi:hypothetical protein
MTWAVPTNVCLPTRASRPDTQRTKRSPQLALPRPRRVGREACPDNGVTQSSWRSSRRPSSFDEICQATHEYAFGQRPLFGYSDAPAWSLGAALRPVAARVYGRSMAGSSGVARRSIAVMSLAGWQIAGRMARHVLRRASCPRCPRAASLFAGVGPDSGQWRDRGRTGRTGPVVPVPGSPGNLWRGCERWPCRSDFQGGTLSGACTAGGVAGIGRGRPVA